MSDIDWSLIVSANEKALALLNERVAAVRAEAQRRIIVLTGTTDLQSCMIKQLNAQMRATELVNKIATGEAWSEDEALEAASLQALADGIKVIRAASNVLEASPPPDFSDDAHWP